MKVPRTKLGATLALAGILGLLWLQDFGRHTDDGCQVEVHCLACRTAVVRSSPAPAQVTAAPLLVVFESVPAARPAAPAQVLRDTVLTRGPPPSL